MIRVKRFVSTITTGNSYTNAIDLGVGQYNRFAVQMPAVNYAATASVNVRVEGASSATGTYHTLTWGNSPASATSGNVPWEVMVARTGIIECNLMAYVPYARLHVLCASTSTGQEATTTTDFVVWARSDS